MDGGDSYDRETGEIITPSIVPQEISQGVPYRPSGPAIVPLASPNCAQVWGALAIAQGAFEAPVRTKTAKVRGRTQSGREYDYEYKYAPLEEILRVVQKPLAENQLFRQQYLVSRQGQWFIRTMIGHSSGEWIACDYPIFTDKEGSQGFASGVTYARRYGLSLALGLAPEDDDDAQAADGLPARDNLSQTASRAQRAPERPREPSEPSPNDAGPAAYKFLGDKIREAETAQALYLLDPKLIEPDRLPAWDALKPYTKHYDNRVALWNDRLTEIREQPLPSDPIPFGQEEAP